MTTQDRVIPIRSPEQDEIESLRKTAARYQHIKANWHDGGLIERLWANVLPEDWDKAIDADMSKEG